MLGSFGKAKYGTWVVHKVNMLYRGWQEDDVKEVRNW